MALSKVMKYYCSLYYIIILNNSALYTK